MDRKADLDPVMFRFAQRLHKDLGAERVILHGPYAMGFPSWDSEYQLIIVSKQFAAVDPLTRSRGIHDLFHDVGGHTPLSLLCVTRDEFDRLWPEDIPNPRELPEALDLLTLNTRVAS